jgi:hypothetical protein
VGWGGGEIYDVIACGDRLYMGSYTGAYWAVYDPAREEIVLFGGFNNTGMANDTWIWRRGVQDRPGHLFNAHFGDSEAARHPDGYDLTGLDITFAAAGEGYDTGGNLTSGVDLLVWRNARFAAVASSTAPLPASGDPVPAVSFSTTDPNLLAGLLAGEEDLLTVGVAPTLGNGTGVATVLSDYVELTVHYELR